MLTRRCWEEMKKRFKNRKAISCYEIRKLNMKEVVRRKRGTRTNMEKRQGISKKGKRGKKIKRLRYNKWYAKVIGKEKKILS